MKISRRLSEEQIKKGREKMTYLPTTERAQRLVTEIFEFVIRNNAVPTRRELTGEHPTFFVWYSGHINELTVHISPNGWSGSEEDETYDVYLSTDEHITAEEIESELEKVLARMAKVMNEWEAKQHDK